jgi:hypothetical protein
LDLCAYCLYIRRNTTHTATLSNTTRIIVTHPFLSFYGNEYLLIKKYTRDGRLFLQCIEISGNKVIALPAIFTDYFTAHQDKKILDAKSYFTIHGLKSVEIILDYADGLST